MSSPLLRAAAVAFFSIAPLAAFADGAGPIRAPHASEAPAPRSAERGDCVPSGPVGQVASVQGDVRAVAPDGSSRALGCDDAVNACDSIVTGAGAGASLLVDDAVVQIGPDSQVALSARPAPELALERGGVRVVDARDEAAQRVQLFTPALSASTGRGDAEITRDGDNVRVCAHDEPLVVMAHDGAKTVPAGSCLETDALGGLAGSPDGTPGVALGDAASCPFYVAGLPGLVPPVSSPPPGGPGVDPYEAPGRDSCDDPGSGCGAVCEICEDPDPGTGCGFPGSPCPE
jgi:hypothetical protein